MIMKMKISTRKKVWIIRILFITIALNLFLFTFRVHKFGLQRDFTQKQKEEYTHLSKNYDENIRNNPSISSKEQRFLSFEVEQKLKKIREKAPYMDWSQYVAKALGWTYFKINKEHVIHPLGVPHGFKEYKQFLKEYKIWKKAKDAKIENYS